MVRPILQATIHVADDVGGWVEGNVTVLDDSMVHWVHNRHPTQDRYILLWHIWHPYVVALWLRFHQFGLGFLQFLLGFHQFWLNFHQFWLF